MKIVIQIGVLLLVLSLLLLAFKLLVKSRLLPLLIWCGLEAVPPMVQRAPVYLLWSVGISRSGHCIFLAWSLSGTQAGRKTV